MKSIWWFSLLLLSTLSGCYNLVPVRTTELPLLNNMHVTQVGTATASNGQTVAVTEVSVRSVHRPDGRTVRIAGQPGVIIHTSAGQLNFDDPVISSLQPGQSLTVAGANRSAVTIPLDQIELVQARVFSPGKTTALWVSLLLGAMTVGTAISLAAIN